MISDCRNKSLKLTEYTTSIKPYFLMWFYNPYNVGGNANVLIEHIEI